MYRISSWCPLVNFFLIFGSVFFLGACSNTAKKEVHTFSAEVPSDFFQHQPIDSIVGLQMVSGRTMLTFERGGRLKIEETPLFANQRKCRGSGSWIQKQKTVIIRNLKSQCDDSRFDYLKGTFFITAENCIVYDTLSFCYKSAL